MAVYTLGIDVGSTTSKAVILKNGKVLSGKALVKAGTGTVGPEQALQEVLKDAGIEKSSIAYTVSTGYGRHNIELADNDMSELSCHAMGAQFIFGNVRTVIDIGGQDIKVLGVENGIMTAFQMNDKCAAGTGRFLEMTMARVDSDIAKIDEFVEGATPVTINSMCAVFAESEIIGLLARETPPGDIVLGCIQSICRRTAIFAQKLAPQQPHVFFSGGLAKSESIRSALARYLGTPDVKTHPLAQYNGAIGAAVLGYRKAKK